MDPTTAIIQFIGIVLFSSQVPGDPGVHAILPRIGHVHKHDIVSLPKPNGEETGIDQVSDTNIENHVSVIMYRDTDRLYTTGGWRSDGPLANGWSYLILDGDRVQFLTNHPNDEPQIPADLPRTGGSSSCRPHDVPPPLRNEFLPPYRGAAAVIDVPQGRLNSCLTSSVNVGSRIDTRLALETKGVLVIVATKPHAAAKALVLKGDAVVFVANIPPYTLRYDTDFTIGEPHWEAYNDMLAGPCAARPERDEQSLLAYCDPEAVGESYLRAIREAPLELKMIDSGCSNTQWP